VRVPVRAPREGWGFEEMVRRTSDLAIVAVAARVALEADGPVARTVGVALSGVSDRVVVADEAALARLSGVAGGDELLHEVAGAVADALRPPSDVHASSEYRRKVAGVLTRRALRAAFERAAREVEAA
jgi:carbon-monoxide dehydrogenase medium subunit